MALSPLTTLPQRGRAVRLRTRLKCANPITQLGGLGRKFVIFEQQKSSAQIRCSPSPLPTPLNASAREVTVADASADDRPTLVSINLAQVRSALRKKSAYRTLRVCFTVFFVLDCISAGISFFSALCDWFWRVEGSLFFVELGVVSLCATIPLALSQAFLDLADATLAKLD